MNVNQINQAQVAVNLLNQITTALAALAGTNPRVSIEVTSDDVAGARIDLPQVPPNLATILQNRQTALQMQLASLGVTLT